MSEDGAKQLVEKYIDGWRQRNVEKILSCMHHDCYVIESHGPLYSGIDGVQQWVQHWFEAGNRVDRWEMTSFFFVKDIAAFEWEFECTEGGKKQKFEGISIARFEQEKIISLREYRMIHPEHKPHLQ